MAASASAAARSPCACRLTTVNEKIRRAHLFFAANGHNSGWSEPDISNPPFIFSEGIAEFSQRAGDGSWLLVPTFHNPLIKPAEYRGKPLTFYVPESRGTGGTWTPFPVQP